jgi:hypothetical protein
MEISYYLYNWFSVYGYETHDNYRIIPRSLGISQRNTDFGRATYLNELYDLLGQELLKC